MLFTKCILSDSSSRDGVRISVMSRHTLSDGKTSDPRIKEFDFHLRILAPSPSLIGSYYKRGLSWEIFEKAYLEEIRHDSKTLSVRSLAIIAMSQDVTIMCIEDTAEHCHRRLLAEECQRYEPNLAVEHR